MGSPKWSTNTYYLYRWTKLNESYPKSWFKTDYYQFPYFRRDWNSKGSEKVIYVKQVLLLKRLRNFKYSLLKKICMEFSLVYFPCILYKELLCNKPYVDKSQAVNKGPFKKYTTQDRKEVQEKSDTKLYRGRGCSEKNDVTHSKFFFSPFLCNCISAPLYLKRLW